MSFIIDGGKLLMLQFANDKVVPAQDELDIENILRKLQEELKLGSDINPKKTEYITVGIIENNKQIEEVT